MRVEDVFGMLQRNFLQAAVVVALLAAVFLVGYFVVYKRLMKGKRRLKPARAVLWLALAGYLVMVLALTLFDRGEGMSSNMNLHLFSAWRDAWNTGRLRSWQLLIFNILMFVPLGILLPLLSKRFRNPIWTVGTGFLLTLFIECSQRWLHWGVFELDDMFLNTLGAVLGYGLIMAGCGNGYGNRNRNGNGKRSLLYLTPVILTVGVFAGMAATYELNEYGNLDDYSYRQNLSGATVSLNTALSDDAETQATVYRIKQYTRDEALELAVELYERLGVAAEAVYVDTEYNDNMIVKANKEEGLGDYLLWLSYDGGHYSLTDFDVDSKRRDEGGAAEQSSLESVEPRARKALEQLGIAVPRSAVFSEHGEEEYQFEVDWEEEEGRVQRGSVTCSFEDSEASVYRLKRVRNNLLTYAEYKKATLISEKEAFERLCDGKFQIYLEEPLKSLEVQEVRLEYALDTKGFYQPVYRFRTAVNGGAKQEIMIPCLT